MPKPRTNTAIGLNRAPGYYSAVVLKRDQISQQEFRSYPFNVPAIAHLDTLELDPKITIIVGENGTGKSTLIEAIAIAAGMNAEGGSKNFSFSTRKSHSVLHDRIELRRGARRERDGFFLRAESMYNFATVLDQLDSYDAPGPKLIKSYGDVSLHEQSHGESFFAVLANRFGEDSFLVMDEPESALSPARQLYLLGQMQRLIVQSQCQFVLSTHSPILMSYPGATLYRLDTSGIARTRLEDTEHFQITRNFLTNYHDALAQLFADPDLKAGKAERSQRRTSRAHDVAQ